MTCMKYKHKQIFYSYKLVVGISIRHSNFESFWNVFTNESNMATSDMAPIIKFSTQNLDFSDTEEKLKNIFNP